MKNTYQRPQTSYCSLPFEEPILVGSIGVSSTTISSNDEHYTIASHKYSPFQDVDDEE